MSEDDDIGLKQALPVPPLPDNFDPSIPPTSGEEYLQHVLYESKKFAPVFKANRLDLSKLNSAADPNVIALKPNLATSSLAPSKEWEIEQIETFTNLRNSVLKLRLQRTANFHEAVFVPEANAPDKAWKAFLRDNQPLLNVVFSMRQEQLQRALGVLLREKSSDHFRVEEGAWIYAVSACLDHPLSREACGDLRDIARKCASIRKTRLDPNDKEVIMMNLIITLVVHYFRQLDLCDD